MTYHCALSTDSLWASTVAWGRNDEEGDASHAFLAETNVSWPERNSWFGRIEVTGKSAHDLDVHETDETFTVAKLQAG